MLNREIPRKVLLARWRDPDDQHWVYTLYAQIA